MAVIHRAAAPQSALDYLSSWGVDPKWVKEDGWDRFGYYATSGIAHWPDEFVRWPSGFDYDKFLRMMTPSITKRAESMLLDDRIAALEERIARLESAK